MSKTLIALALACVLPFAGCKPAESAPTKKPAPSKPAPAPKGTKIEHTDAMGAAKKIAADAKIEVLDVRTPGEFGRGHIKGAILVDYKGSDFAEKLQSMDKNKTYIMHCKSGGRSTAALKTFEELGFAHVIHLDGGFDAWKAAKQAVEK